MATLCFAAIVTTRVSLHKNIAAPISQDCLRWVRAALPIPLFSWVTSLGDSLFGGILKAAKQRWGESKRCFPKAKLLGFFCFVMVWFFFGGGCI